MEGDAEGYEERRHTLFVYAGFLRCTCVQVKMQHPGRCFCVANTQNTSNGDSNRSERTQICRTNRWCAFGTSAIERRE